MSGPWSPDIIRSVEHMRRIGLSITEADAILARVRAAAERLYPDFPFDVTPDGLSVSGELGLMMGPDLHDTGEGRVTVAAGDYDRPGDIEAALLGAVLDYLSGREWRDPDVMAVLCDE